MTKSYPWLQNILVCGFTLLASTPALSQITPDNTLGAESSQLAPNVTINGAAADRIEGGATRGSNLFHSFSEFNIDNGQRVYFGNPAGIQNILTRVTGGQASNILGTLGVDGAANLLLINPNGIIFGSNARLDVRGSFVGTTANAIDFGEQGSFSATNPEALPLLTVNPSALLFNQLSAQSPPAIENRGFLQVLNSQSLLLVGGDVRLDQGIVAALGGRVELGGLAGTSSIELDFDRGGLQLRPLEAGQRADVSLTNRSIVDVSSGGGGDVAIYARNLDVLAGSRIYAGIYGGLASVDSQAGDITLNATDTIQVVASSFIGNDVNLNETGNAGNLRITSGSLFLTNGARLSASTFGVGAAGDLTIQTGSLQVFNGAQVRASTFGAGKGGNLNITANRVELSNGLLSAQARKDATGNAGNLTIQTDTLLVQDGGLVSAGTYGAGQGGNLTVKADRVQLSNGFLDTQASPNTIGNAGNLTIDTGILQVLNGAQVSSSTYGAGKGGSLTVNASEKVEVIGISGDGKIGSGLSAQTRGDGDASNLTITTGRLLVRDGAQVSTSTFGRGKGGTLSVIASDAVEVIGSSADGKIVSGLSAQTQGNGDASNLTITTGRLLVRDGAQVSTSTFGRGNGGTLSVTAADAVEVIGMSANSQFPSRLTAQTQGDGDAIDLTIATGRLTIRDGAEVTVSSQGRGNAGDVEVRARNLLLDNQGKLTSESESGNGGNITHRSRNQE